MKKSKASAAAGKPLVVPTVPTAGPVPVTLLSGFLGSGKTTLLEHILRNKEGLRCAVIVNDMAEVNIDASLVKGTKLLHTKERMIELHNGCICCTLREDFLMEVRQLALSNNAFDVIVIESTGIAEPMQVAEAFFMDLDDGRGLLNNVARLDNCITVVDASSFFDYLKCLDSVGETFKATEATDEDDRNISHLLIDQVEFANLILLNKVDLVSEERVRQTMHMLKTLNPSAHVVCTTRSSCEISKILFTNEFTEEFAVKAKGWMADIETGVKHNPETLEYGIGSWVYRADKPFHPKRLYDFITRYFMLQELSEEPEEGEYEEDLEQEGAPAPADDDNADCIQDKKEAEAKSQQRLTQRIAEIGNVFRSKGYVWVGSPSRLGSYGEWSQAGNMLSFACGGGWGVFPETLPKAGEKQPKFIEKTPCQELVFIGQEVKREVVTQMLDACLLRPDEEELLTQAMHRYNEAQEEEQQQACSSSPVAPSSAAASSSVATLFDDPFETWNLADVEEDEQEEEDDDEGTEGRKRPRPATGDSS